MSLVPANRRSVGALAGAVGASLYNRAVDNYRNRAVRSATRYAQNRISNYYRQMRRRPARNASRPTKRAIAGSKITPSLRVPGRRKRGGIRKRGGGRRRRSSKKTPAICYNQRTYVTDFADTVVVPAPTGTAGAADTVGKKVVYAYAGCSTNSGSCTPLMGLPDMLAIANQLTANQNTLYTNQYFSDVKISFIDSYQKTDIVNTSNGSLTIMTWHLKCRRDVAARSDTNYQNMYNMLGNGFYQRGIGSAGQSFSTNPALNDATYTVFDSHKICSEFIVTPLPIRKLDPGQETSYSIKQGKQMVNYEHYMTQTDRTVTIQSQIVDYSHRKGESMLLFRFEGQPANDATTKTNITYTTPKVDMITKTHYNWFQMNPSASLITKATPVGYSVSTQPELMIDESGVVANAQNA